MSRSISIEDLYEFKFLSRPRISADSQRVAFVVTSIDRRTYAYCSAIWVMPTAGGEAIRFTGGNANAHSPVWSPDGQWLAFVSDREGELQGGDTHEEQKQRGKGKAQIWLIPTGGGEAHQLTFMPHGAAQPIWSPNSQQILFSAVVGPLDEEAEDGKPLPKVRVIDRLLYRLDGVGFVYDRRQHLFLIDAEGGTPVQLTDGDWDDKDAAWSPDGTKIAFTSGRTEDRWRTRCTDIYTLSIDHGEYGEAGQAGQAGELLRLTDGTRYCNSPSWSPDGQSLAFLSSTRYRAAGHVDLFTISPPTKDGLLRNLTSEFEGSCSDWTNSDVTDEHMMPAPPWSPDGKALYVLAGQRGSSRVFAIPSNGARRGPIITSPPERVHAQAISPNNVHALDFSMDANRQKMVTLIESPAHLAEVFVCTDIADRAGIATHRLTNCNDGLFDELVLATPEYMPYTGEDGWPIDGWLLKPQDFDPTKKYPLIVEVHGGPHTQYGYGFMHEMQMLAAAGYVVLFTNPRGSLGYGRDFALALRGAWAEKDSLDILAGVDTVIQKGFIDEQRLAVIGGSYGGFMSSWLVGHTDRFKAAVADRSVINRLSFFGSSDIGWEYTDDELEVPPWDDPERYMHSSPITYVKNIHTPLLIIHSENDLRCSIEQSEQLFASLKYLGREVLFVRFEGQSHGLSRGGHPHSRVERLKHIQKWFADHLG